MLQLKSNLLIGIGFPSILLVVYENQVNDVMDFINTSKKDSITISTLIIYEGKPEQKPNPHFEHTVLDKKAFTLFGLPKINLDLKQVDVLINLGNETQLKSLALSKLLPATCKVSCFTNNIFDITVQSNSNLNCREYLNQVKTYLKMINPL